MSYIDAIIGKDMNNTDLYSIFVKDYGTYYVPKKDINYLLLQYLDNDEFWKMNMMNGYDIEFKVDDFFVDLLKIRAIKIE